MSCRNVTMTWQSSLSVRTRRSGQMERRPSLMAEVLEFWPQQKPKAEARFSYPWAQWMALDEDGIGDIWLAEQGIDWPADANAMRFRPQLTTRAKSVSNSRKNRARYVLKRVSTPDGAKVRKVLDRSE